MRRAHAGAWELAPLAVAGEDPLLAALNHALAREIACYLRHKREFFAARDVGAGSAAQDFLAHAQLDLAQAQLLAACIVTLGAAPDFAPQELADADRIAMRLMAG